MSPIKKPGRYCAPLCCWFEYTPVPDEGLAGEPKAMGSILFKARKTTEL
jgi:hypothetical protein